MAESEISSRLAAVRDRIRAACLATGRDPREVNLLAVSKTKPAAMVVEAMDCGQHDFGENYLQEAIDKIESVPTSVCWHFVGAIQSNKTRQIAVNFDWAHAVSSEKVARRLGAQRPAGRAPLKALIQVNISAETSKSGVSPDQAPILARAIAGFEGIEVCGLMAIPAPDPNEAVRRRAFSQLRALRDSIRDDNMPEFTELSMGMTDDLELAVAEGATWVRIGTAIFGNRG